MKNSSSDNFSKQVLWILLSIFIIFADQFSKYLSPVKEINSGVSFGVNLPFTLFIIVFFFVATILFLLKFYPPTAFIGKLGRVFFLAGAFSNLLDRLFFTGVRDWLQLPFFNFTNNFAAIFIIIGFLGIIGDEIINLYLVKKSNTQSKGHK
ncbi:MAG: signal peptidase II [Candidatus Pacebacteria bacterium]|nr:signal peptidase II [Candidatus Paceibacterota bacterium]